MSEFKMHLKGEKLDHIAAREYILKLYLRENPDPERSCYSHFTTATGYLFSVKRCSARVHGYMLFVLCKKNSLKPFYLSKKKLVSSSK